MQSDIRKWFMKQPNKGNGNAPTPQKPAAPAKPPAAASAPLGKAMQGVQECSGRKKTSKYFSDTIPNPTAKGLLDDEGRIDKSSAKRKNLKNNEESQDDAKPFSARKNHKGDDDDDFVLPNDWKMLDDEISRAKKLMSGSGRAVNKYVANVDENDEDIISNKVVESCSKVGGRGGGGRGQGARPAGGRGRGRGGFMNFGSSSGRALWIVWLV